MSREKWGHLLWNIEGEGEVVPPVSRVQLVELEGLRVEVVDERAERDAVVPARREVGHVHILEEERKTEWCVTSRAG